MSMSIDYQSKNPCVECHLLCRFLMSVEWQHDICISSWFDVIAFAHNSWSILMPPLALKICILLSLWFSKLWCQSHDGWWIGFCLGTCHCVTEEVFHEPFPVECFFLITLGKHYVCHIPILK